MAALHLTSPARRRGGAVAHRAGTLAEDLVERLHASPLWRARNPGVYLLRRNIGVVVAGGKARHVAPQGPDFGGGGPARRWGGPEGIGRWIEVEVKAVAPERPRLEFARFTETETTALTACHAAGGLAVVLVLVGPIAAPARLAWCAVPWNVVAAARACGDASMGADELRWHQREPVDYLGGERREALR